MEKSMLSAKDNSGRWPRKIVWLIALLIGLWSAPDVYGSGCEGWRKLAPEAKVFESICIYTAD